MNWLVAFVILLVVFLLYLVVDVIFYYNMKHMNKECTLMNTLNYMLGHDQKMSNADNKSEKKDENFTVHKGHVDVNDVHFMDEMGSNENDFDPTFIKLFNYGVHNELH